MAGSQGSSKKPTRGRPPRPAAKVQLEAELHPTRTNLADVEALARIGSWEWDILTGAVVWSEGLYALWGVSPATFRPTYEAVLGMVHPEDRPFVQHIIERARRELTPYECEHRIVHPNGSVRLLHSRGTVMADEHGRAIKMFGTGQDITEQRYAEDARARYATVIESSSDAIYTKTLDGRILSWNAAAERLYGYRADEAIGRSVTMLAMPDRADEVLQFLERLRRGERIDEFQTVRRRKDGSRVEVSVTLSPIRDSTGTIVGAASIARDFTALRRNEEALVRSRAQLRAFAGRLRSTREEERTRIAREIHDELGQALTALKIDLFSLVEAFPGDLQGVFEEKTREMAVIIDTMIDQIRSLATELRPGVLDNLGLGPAVEWAVQQFARRTGIRCTVDLPAEPIRLDADRSTDVFRIVQEALTNVARHAHATTLDVQLQVVREVVAITIHDNGRGITADELQDVRAFGLLGMRERALLWGGEVEIRAPPEGGTSITVSIPLTPAPPGTAA
jgi:PAS domain S-box-containing protein